MTAEELVEAVKELDEEEAKSIVAAVEAEHGISVDSKGKGPALSRRAFNGGVLASLGFLLFSSGRASVKPSTWDVGNTRRRIAIDNNGDVITEAP